MTINLLEELSLTSWTPDVDAAAQARTTDALESGRILYLPALPFSLAAHEQRFLSAIWSNGNSKNIYLRGSERGLRGAQGNTEDLAALQAMIERYARYCQTLIAALLPYYAAHLKLANTSFRPCEISGRASSYRKDDTRLHADAFPSNPTGGTRILRVFTNVNPYGKPRSWRVGEPFAEMAKKFLPRARRVWPGEASLLHALHITKRRRTVYDHLMLELHDKVKADLDYQQNAAQQHIDFPPGASWIVFSDQVLHAAMSGQFMMEQTLMLPVNNLRNPESSPLRMLEKIIGHILV